ncbi:MAG TPA: glycosyltransferase, partial [Gammaproteobacteria bacterium]|nr:glycosyltransferase [Gammaproteobacteria bacterium]
ARERVPLDLVGMSAEEAGGVGEVRHDVLPQFAARYRFFFNPIRYTSLGLAVVEAMMIGLPVVALATTEMATVVENGTTGYVDTSLDRLIARMQELVAAPAEARRLGSAARAYARERFAIGRFVADWNAALEAVAA